MTHGEPPASDELDQPALKRVGTTIAGKWHLDRILGVGGTAAVYAARHRNGKWLAVKVLHPAHASRPELVQRFLYEAHAANQVDHPGVVSVLDDSTTDDGCAALVMELLEGDSLQALLWRSPSGTLALLDVLSITYHLLDVLAAVHERDIVHRDIKPDNVFLTRDGRVKLLDFGIARLTETQRTLRTRAGETMGTPVFMAPEHARGRWDEIDARTDLWSVGATMFVALSGRFVHEGETMNEELLSAMTQPAPRLTSVAPAVPERVGAIVDHSLAFEKDGRYTGAREMQADVRAAFIELGGDPEVLDQQPRRESFASLTRLDGSPTTHRPVATASIFGALRSPRSAVVRWAIVASIVGLVSVMSAVTALRLWSSTEEEAPLPRAQAAATKPANELDGSPARRDQHAIAPMVAPVPSSAAPEPPAFRARAARAAIRKLPPASSAELPAKPGEVSPPAATPSARPDPLSRRK